MRLDFKSFLGRCKGRIAGVAVSIAACVLIFTIGFWATLLISAIVAIGFLIGRAADKGDNIGDAFKGLLDKVLRKRS